MKAIVLLFALLMVTPVLAQSGNHNDGHSDLHEYYKNLFIPNLPEPAPGSCCRERIVWEDGTVTGDCRPVQAWMDLEGKWHARVGSIELIIPDDKIIRDGQPPAPDGNSHLCMSEIGVIYCFVPGQPKI